MADRIIRVDAGGRTVVVAGADLLGPLVASASDAAAAAQAAAATAVGASGQIATLAAGLVPLTINHWSGTATTFLPGIRFVAGFQALQPTEITGVKAKLTGASNYVLQRVRSNRDGGFVTVGARVALSFASSGTHIWTAADIQTANGGQPLVLRPGEYLVRGVQNDSGLAGGLGIITAGSDAVSRPYRSFAAEPGTVSAPMNYSLITLDGSGAASGGAQLDDEITAVLAPPAPGDRSADVEIERYDRFAVVPGAWAGSATVDGSGALNLAGNLYGASNMRALGLDRVRYAFEFSLPSSAQLLCSTYCRAPIDSGQFEGSLFAVESSSNQVHVYGRYDPGTTGVVEIVPTDARAVTYADGSAAVLLANHRYALGWTKDGRDQIVRVYDPDGPLDWSTLVTWRNGAGKAMDGYTVTSYSPLTKYGLMHGALALGVSGGTGKLFSLVVTADYDRFLDELHVGDSLTEGFSLFMGERVGDARAALLGSRRVAVSGVGGARTGSGINRLFWLLDAMRPARVYLAFGTNGPDPFSQTFPALLQLCRDAGARVFAMRFPDGSYQNDTLDAYPEVTQVRAGNAVTDPGSPRTKHPPYYALTFQDTGGAYPGATGDMTHWNAKGAARIADQLRRDI